MRAQRTQRFRRAAAQRTLLGALLGALVAWPSASAQALPLTEVLAQATPAKAAVSAQELKAQYQAELKRRQSAQANLEPLERQYDALAARIDAIKRRGVTNLNRGELQELMRQGRKLAEQLGQVQRAIQQSDAQLERLGQAILAHLDGQMRALESELVRAQGPARRQAVAQLNALSRERAVYAQPLPQLDLRKIESMLRMAEGLDHPDDMLAMADELQDAEQGVLKKLEWVNARLDELKARKRLLQRASSFSREERFFEESARTRAVARVERRDASAPPRAEAAAPPARGGQDDASAAPNGPEFSNDSAAPALPGRDVSVSAPVTQGPTAPAPSGAQDDPFGPPQGSVVISREADPAALQAPSSGRDDRDLEDKIHQLERDQRALKQQAEALKRRARALRQEAGQP